MSELGKDKETSNRRNLVHSYSTSAYHDQPKTHVKPKPGLEWSLRSLKSIDTGARFFLSAFYEQPDHTDESHEAHLPERDQSAYEIFKTNENPSVQNEKCNISNQQKTKFIWAAMHTPIRRGVVDGKKVVFELENGMTQKPEINRKDRMQRRFVVKNAISSSWEVKVRLWLMQFSLTSLSLVFLTCFVIMNLWYAFLLWLPEDGCCRDPTMTFGDHFAFAVQTSTTTGYGFFSPRGHLANFLVFFLSFTSTLLNTIFAGLFFTRFVTPTVNIQFSDVMTLCNVNGIPCLSVRLGNADGDTNTLTDVNVRLTYSYQIPYYDYKGDMKYFRQTEELKLLENRRHSLVDIWTLQHVMDESSPLFGLHFQEHPADKIFMFTLSVDVVQESTKSNVNIQTDYALEDVMIGYIFQDHMDYDEETRTVSQDFSKMSEVEPYPVWYPAPTGAYAETGPIPSKNYSM